jgi:sulfur relay (sulfurtransferase) complex TusBCD TusD component (DsrE family)
MKRMKLVFFVGTNPAEDTSRLSAAYRFASAAAEADIDAEVRLAGDAVLVADPAFVATVPGAVDLRRQLDDAAARRIRVSVCPRSVERRGINDDQVTAIGAQPRALSEILVDVAEGRSVLVHVG